MLRQEPHVDLTFGCLVRHHDLLRARDALRVLEFPTDPQDAGFHGGNIALLPLIEIKDSAPLLIGLLLFVLSFFPLLLRCALLVLLYFILHRRARQAVNISAMALPIAAEVEDQAIGFTRGFA